MKLSYYTTILQQENTTILHNAYSGKIMSFEGKAKERIEHYLNHLGKSEDFEIEKLLYKNGFIVEKEVDEIQKCDDFEKEVFNGSGVLKLIIMPTEQCNFRCKYCYEEFAKGKMSKELQDALILFIERNIKNYKALNVEWFGGEPLLAIDVIRNLSKNFIQICRNYKKPYLAQMTTNAYLLTEELAEELYKLHVNQFQITLDGLAETHDVFRCLANGEGSFATIIKNLREISKLQKHVSVLLRTNFTKDILENIDAYIDFIAKEFSEFPNFTLEWRPASDMGGGRVHLIKDKFIKGVNMFDLLVNKEKEAMDKGMQFLDNLHALRPGGRVCYAAKENSYIVGSDGNIYKCTDAFYSENGKIGVLSLTGEIQINPEKETYWIGNKKSGEIEKCRFCKVRPICLAAACPKRNHDNKEITCPEVKYDLEKFISFFSVNPNICKVIKEDEEVQEYAGN